MGAANRLQWFKRAAATSMMLMGGTSAAVIGPQVLDELIEEAELSPTAIYHTSLA